MMEVLDLKHGEFFTSPGFYDAENWAWQRGGFSVEKPGDTPRPRDGGEAPATATHMEGGVNDREW
jgi:hypothetical protein